MQDVRLNEVRNAGDALFDPRHVLGMPASPEAAARFDFVLIPGGERA